MSDIEDVENEAREFYFESDHVALRSNKDYRNMLRYLIALESQKIAIIKDIETLSVVKNKALNNPDEFLDDLKSNNLELPPAYVIPEMPMIEWSKYGMPDDTVERLKDRMSDAETDAKNILIRGRAFDQSKPQTFNQLWTCEEQKRLEELLIQYPEEEIEMRRWTKIAEALGNRTPKQVMSRVQKYFIKLQRAGLPIPGRKTFLLKSGSSKGQRNIKVLQRRSTFFPNQHVPVLMEEQGNDDYDSESAQDKEWTAIELMQAVYERRKIEEISEEPLPVHMGISCVSCKTPDIIGTRWTDRKGSDWCSDCLIQHRPTTRLVPISSTTFEPA